MRRQKKEHPELKTDGWLATFGDLTSLMLTFFVLLVAMSSIDKHSLQQISGAMQAHGTSVLQKGKAQSGSATGSANGPQTYQEHLLATRQQALHMFRDTPWRGKVHMQIIDEKMLFSLPATMLFAPGQATMKPSDIAQLRRLSFMLKLVPGSIRVEGHTYREHPVPGSPYHNSQELSLARAASVLHVLLQAGVEERRLSLAGYGDAHPVSTGTTPMAIAKNRRVDIVLYKDTDMTTPAAATQPQSPR